MTPPQGATVTPAKRTSQQGSRWPISISQQGGVCTARLMWQSQSEPLTFPGVLRLPPGAVGDRPTPPAPKPELFPNRGSIQ